MLKKITLTLLICLVLFSSAQAAPPPNPAPKVIYGYDREFPPYSYQEAGGKPVGFEVDLVESIFRGKDVNLQMRPLDWDMIQLELANEQITFTSGMVKTKQRAEIYLFSEKPTIAANIRFFTKNNNRVANASLLRGQTVSVEEGSYPQRLMEQYGGIIIKTYKTKQDALKALYKDDVYAYCGPEANAYYIMNKLKLTGITAMGTPLKLSQMYFAVNIERPDVLETINEGMRRLIANGEYDRIYRKWFVLELLDEERDKLIESATNASISAYAPYSHKTNGAAVLTMSGKIYTGARIENAETTLNTSALRSALISAASAGDMEIRAAVTTDERGNVQPASSDDRQLLYEFNRGALIILQDSANSYVTKTAGELLPTPVVNMPAELLEE